MKRLRRGEGRDNTPTQTQWYFPLSTPFCKATDRVGIRVSAFKSGTGMKLGCLKNPQNMIICAHEKAKKRRGERQYYNPDPVVLPPVHPLL